jgi:topoisomerase-4 subunit B
VRAGACHRRHAHRRPSSTSPAGSPTISARPVAGQTISERSLFSGRVEKEGGHGSVEWALGWTASHDGFVHSYCNTIPTAEGGTHEAGLRAALTRGLKAYGEMVGNKKPPGSPATMSDLDGAAMLSVFIREPEFQGQTKDKLATQRRRRIVEGTVRDAFDHWLTAIRRNRPTGSSSGWSSSAESACAGARKSDINAPDGNAQAAPARQARRLLDRIPRTGTEIFIVEGDSAGGSAKQARNRATQAILPLRGKILNVANATADKLRQTSKSPT